MERLSCLRRFREAFFQAHFSPPDGLENHEIEKFDLPACNQIRIIPQNRQHPTLAADDSPSINTFRSYCLAVSTALSNSSFGDTTDTER